MASFAILLTVIGGITLSSQSAVNAGLGKRIGTVESALVSFVTGACFLSVLVLFFGQGNILGILDAPLWQLSAVFCGTLYVLFSIIAVPKIGIISVSTLVISGQLSMGLIIDHFGWFHMDAIPFDGRRALALVFMGLALYFIYKGNHRK